MNDMRERAHGVTQLAPKTEDRLLAALAESRTIKEAAEKAGISYDHARHLVTQEPLKSRLAELREEATEQALFEMTELSEVARQTLLEVLTDPQQPGYVKVNAARVVLDYAQALRDGGEVEAKLDALEQLLDNAQQDRSGGYRPAGY